MRESPNHEPVKPNDAPLLSHWWWIPSAFAILALLVLLVVPTIVDKRLAKVRAQLIAANEAARVPVNDLEATFASELLARNSDLPPGDMPAFASKSKRDADNAQLRATVYELGPPAIAYYTDLNDRLNAWDRSPHDGSAQSTRQGLDLLASAERLDSLLTTMTVSRRTEALRLERVDVMTAAILAPITIVAMIFLIFAGQRTLRFARLAEQKRDEAVRAGEARAALLRGITHDVKNPLGAAAGYAQLIEDGIVGPVAPRQLEMVHRINRLVQTASHTISALLELARSDGELRVEYTTTDLAEIVNQVFDDHLGMARERGIELEVVVPSTPIVTDETHVRQILSNVVSNAIKYTPAGGRVHATIIDAKQAAKRGEVVGVEIRDTGPGVPFDLHEKIFEEFFRINGTNDSGADGNGLGLAISRRLARLLGGDITLSDPDGGGAAFTLWLKASAMPRPMHERSITTAPAA